LRQLQKDSDFNIISYEKEILNKVENDISKFHLQAAFFETGEQTIPSFKFNIINGNDTTAVFSDSIAVQINSVVSEDSTHQNIKDVAKPVALNLTAWDIVFPLIILIIIVVFVILLFKRKSVKSIIPTKKEEKKPAHIIALQKLEKLELSNLLEEGKVKQFYVNLSWICREYLENRYHIPVLESTTSEIRLLTRKNNIDFYAKFVNLLLQCDKVKYARYHKTISESRDMLQLLKDLINKTRKQNELDENENNIS